MKNLIIILAVLTIVVTSCQKANIAQPSTPVITEHFIMFKATSTCVGEANLSVGIQDAGLYKPAGYDTIPSNIYYGTNQSSYINFEKKYKINHGDQISSNSGGMINANSNKGIVSYDLYIDDVYISSSINSSTFCYLNYKYN